MKNIINEIINYSNENNNRIKRAPEITKRYLSTAKSSVIDKRKLIEINNDKKRELLVKLKSKLQYQYKTYGEVDDLDFQLYTKLLSM